MVSGTLYTYPGNYRAQKIQIAAAYSGADVKLATNFEFGVTNASEAFLTKFPMGKVPAFEDSTGVYIIYILFYWKIGYQLNQALYCIVKSEIRF